MNLSDYCGSNVWIMKIKCIERDVGYWVAYLMLNETNYALGIGTTEELAKQNLYEKFKVMLWNRIETEELLRDVGKN